MAAPIGILGGTFDPIHYGHLRLAQEVADKLRLAEVRFLPSGTPPHRSSPGAPAEDRLAMVQLGVSGNSLFTVDPRETLRAGPGYTVDTLTAMRAEVGPAQSLVLLLGADAFLELATWSRWHQLFNLSHVAVAEYNKRLMRQPLVVHTASSGGIVVVPIAALDISATLIRDAMVAGANPRYLLPDQIIKYIQEHSLYTGD